MTTIDSRTELERGRAALLEDSPRIEWEQRDTFLFTQSTSWLIVESGEVDLFAVAVEDGDTPRGPWHSLARLKAGDVIASSVAGPRHRLLCRQVKDAQVRIIPMVELRRRIERELKDQPRGGPATRALCDGIASAITRTDRSVRRGLPPRDFVGLSRQAVYDLPAGTARPVGNLLWVEVRDGRVFQGGNQEEYGVGDKLCVTRHDWLSMPDGAVLKTSSTQDMVRSRWIWHELVTRWTRFLYSVDRAVERKLVSSHEALERSAQRDENAQLSVSRENDRLLVEASSNSVLSIGHDHPGHVEAIVRVLAETKEDTTVPETVRQRRDISDFEQFGSSGWVRTRGIRLEGRWWTVDMGPVVGYWGPDHLPVAFLYSDGGYVAHSSLLDKPERVTSESHFSAGRTVWSVYPRLPQSIRSVKGLMRYGARSLGPELWIFGTMAVLVGICGLLTPILNGQILGNFVSSSNRPLIIQAGIAVVLSAVVTAAFSIVQNLVVLRLQGAFTARTQAGVWGRLLDLPVSFFERFSTGRLGTIVLSVKAAQELLSGVVVSATLGLVIVVANSLLIFYYSVSLALVAMVLAAAAGGLCYVTGRKILTIERERYEAEQKLNGMGYETLSAIAKVRGAAAEERAFIRWSGQQRSVQAITLQSRRLQDRLTVFNGVYPIVGLAVIFTAANLMPNPPEMASLLSFMTAFTLLINALLQFTGSILTAAAMVPMIESLGPILEAQPESGIGKAHPGELSGEVALRGVSYRYGEDGPLVLEDVTMEIHAGEFVAIVGPSGSGKSTLVRLMLGFATPLSGGVQFDGQDLAELDLSAVRGQCGVVLQAGALMPGDIRDNISGGGQYSEDDIWEAADMAGLGDDIREMPMGLGTIVNENSHGLSGGQVQRLMIARSLVNKPRFVIFDEATSALDNPTQKIVAEATRQLNATRIVVAHRLSTIRDADRIFVLDKGQVVQVGSYDELMEDQDGVFARLARRQGSE